MYLQLSKSVLRYKFLISVTRHLDVLYLRQRGCKDSWLFFEAKRGPRKKLFGKNCSRCLQRYDMTYLLTEIGLTPCGSSTVHIYIQTVHRTTQVLM